MMKTFLIIPVSVFLITIGYSQGQEKIVVFVCEHGGARSTIASAYFNKIAEEKNLPYRSIFRGLTPDPSITKETEQGLQKDGFNTNLFFPAKLTLKDVTSTTILISLDCNVPNEFQARQVWKGIPPISENYAMARNQIVKLINSLIEDLNKK